MISVIIITYNRKLLLGKTVDSILAQDSGGKFEIIIVDNGSEDRTTEYIRKEYGEKVKLSRAPARTGLAACKESGVAMAQGEIIAFIDDDCLAAESWLKNIKESMRNYDFLAGPVLAPAGTKFPWWWRSSLNWLVGINPAPGKKFPPLGSNIAFKKSVFGITGSGTERLLLPYAEDRIRVARLLDAGYTMGLAPDMTVYHYIPPERLKIVYLIKRSYKEGVASAALERNLKTVIINALGLLINPARLTLFRDINYFFRLIANLSYLFNLIIPSFQRHRNQNGNCISYP